MKPPPEKKTRGRKGKNVVEGAVAIKLGLVSVSDNDGFLRWMDR